MAVWFEQELTLNPTPWAVVAFGVYVPSHISIRCREYHSLIPSVLASLSAMSFSISPRAFAMSSPMPGSRGIKPVRPLTMLPGDIGVGVEPESLADVGIRFCPTSEVLS